MASDSIASTIPASQRSALYARTACRAYREERSEAEARQVVQPGRAQRAEASPRSFGT